MSPEFVLQIGKHKGKTVRWVMLNDRRYFEWAKANVPDMFEPYKPKGTPKSLDTQTGGKPKSLDTQNEGEPVARDPWTNPHLFYEIAQRALREKGEG
jgi:hypothetical protein